MTPGDAICSECGRQLEPFAVSPERCPLHPKARVYYVMEHRDGYLWVDYR